jgi:hypothetical protein
MRLNPEGRTFLREDYFENEASFRVSSGTRPKCATGAAQFRRLRQAFSKLVLTVGLKQSVNAALALALCLSACKQHDPDHERRAAVTTTLTQLQSCLRPRTETTQAQLAIVEITRLPQEMSVRLVAYATDKPVEFYLPVYLMSRGRWLISERERAFLLDEYCQEFRMRDRKSTNGAPLPLDGKVVLPPGTAFEFKLSFARMPEETRLGALVYGARVLPFSLLEGKPDGTPVSPTPALPLDSASPRSLP